MSVFARKGGRRLLSFLLTVNSFLQMIPSEQLQLTANLLLTAKQVKLLSIMFQRVLFAVLFQLRFRFLTSFMLQIPSRPSVLRKQQTSVSLRSTWTEMLL
mgnify:CR=1 FL=1